MAEKKYIVNNVGFLYNYFKALEDSVHTDPHEVNYRNKNYIFKCSRNDYAYHTVEYVFDNEPEMYVQIDKEEFHRLISEMKTKAHRNMWIK